MRLNHSIKIYVLPSLALIVVLLMLLLSCTDKNPAGILPKDEMVRILTDIYVAEGKITVLNLQADSAKNLFSKFEVKVFEHAGIAESTFNKSYDYYLSKPLELEQIYTALSNCLRRRVRLRLEVEIDK